MINSLYHTTLLYCCCTKLWSEQLRQSNELAYQFVCKERETSQYVRPADPFQNTLIDLLHLLHRSMVLRSAQRYGCGRTVHAPQSPMTHSNVCCCLYYYPSIRRHILKKKWGIDCVLFSVLCLCKSFDTTFVCFTFLRFFTLIDGL